jgi:hypothetical protein
MFNFTQEDKERIIEHIKKVRTIKEALRNKTPLPDYADSIMVKIDAETFNKKMLEKHENQS